MHSGCADPCEFPKCGNLDCIISGSGGLRSRSPLDICSRQAFTCDHWRRVGVWPGTRLQINDRLAAAVNAYGHTTPSTPDLVCSRKLSRVGPGEYLDQRPPGNTGCCQHFLFLNACSSSAPLADDTEQRCRYPETNIALPHSFHGP